MRISFSLPPTESQALIKELIETELVPGVWVVNLGGSYGQKLTGPFDTISSAHESRNFAQTDYTNAQYLMVVWPEFSYLCGYRYQESLLQTELVLVEVDSITFEITGIRFINEDGEVLADHPSCIGQFYDTAEQPHP